MVCVGWFYTNAPATLADKQLGMEDTLFWRRPVADYLPWPLRPDEDAIATIDIRD
jgi:hypothetical protein